MSRVFKDCRAMLAAAKAETPKRSSAATKRTPPPSKRPLSSSAGTPRTLARPTGILKLTPISPALRKFLGVPEVSRTDAVKQIWAYIKLHNLQASGGSLARDLWSSRLSKFYYGCNNASDKFAMLWTCVLRVRKSSMAIDLM